MRTSSLIIRGDLSADEDVRIEGSFEGSIDLHGHDLLTGERSRVDASVSARTVTLLGEITGHIVADAVDIGRTADVQANVMTKQLTLADGARFNGSVNTERARAAVEVARHRSGQRVRPAAG